MIISTIENDHVEVRINMTKTELEILQQYSLTPETFSSEDDYLLFNLIRTQDNKDCIPLDYMESLEKLTKAFMESGKQYE